MKVLITGCMGFIGSNLVRYWAMRHPEDLIIGFDSMTYAAMPEYVWSAVREFDRRPFPRGFDFRCVDLRDPQATMKAVIETAPDAIFHLAAESHVCRSIDGPRAFFESNVMGTFNLLEAARRLWSPVRGVEWRSPQNRFVHVSTDEVFGELGPEEPPFDEDTPLAPRSPYAASKAGSDHAVQCFYHTYGLNTVITNCSNNFGPNQNEEKLIPKTIKRLLNSEPVTLYGAGTQVRDWIYVLDHCTGLDHALKMGKAGQRYCFGGRQELTNLQMVTLLHEGLVRELKAPISRIIVNTPDRPTDDFRYAIDCRRAREELGWSHRGTFEENLETTIRWYVTKYMGGVGVRSPAHGGANQP